MKIEHYSWGQISIDGQTYTSDVIIYPDRVDSSWWRQEGHNLHIEDLTDVISTKPEAVIIGTGALGVMKVKQEIKSHLESIGMEVHIERTGKAAELFNRLAEKKIVVAALHLTC